MTLSFHDRGIEQVAAQDSEARLLLERRSNGRITSVSRILASRQFSPIVRPFTVSAASSISPCA
jgi:hypothetical protein